MSSTISVTIISKEGRILAKEVNPLGEKPVFKAEFVGHTQEWDYKFNERYNNWFAAEDKLRTWDIEEVLCECEYSVAHSAILLCFKKCTKKLVVGSQYQGEIISNNLIKIIQ